MKYFQNVITDSISNLKIPLNISDLYHWEEKDDIVEIYKDINSRGIHKSVVIGMGTNTLFSERSYNGAVLLNKYSECESFECKRFLPSGLSLANAILGLIKIENTYATKIRHLGLIPGTVGASVVNNVSLRVGATFGEILESIEYFDTKKKRFLFMNPAEANFIYRGSIFRNDDTKIITGVEIREPHLLKEYIEFDPVEYSKKRTKYFLKPSLGSWFRPIWITKEDFYKNKELSRLSLRDDGLLLVNNIIRIPVRVLVKHLGLSGYTIGGAQISPSQCNFLIRSSEASGEDFVKLSKHIEEKVFERYGVRIEREVIII
jgi:UDP-N-acetylmuramate dehydrogenase